MTKNNQFLPGRAYFIHSAFHDTADDFILFCKKSLKGVYGIFSPANGAAYLKEELIPLMEAISWGGSKKNPFIFIITHAEHLSPLLQTMLLKTIESLHEDHYVFFHSAQDTALTPPLRSRCIFFSHSARAGSMQKSLKDIIFFCTTPKTFDQCIMNYPFSESAHRNALLALFIFFKEKGNEKKAALVKNYLMAEVFPGTYFSVWRSLYGLVHEK